MKPLDYGIKYSYAVSRILNPWYYIFGMFTYGRIERFILMYMMIPLKLHWQENELRPRKQRNSFNNRIRKVVTNMKWIEAMELPAHLKRCYLTRNTKTKHKTCHWFHLLSYFTNIRIYCIVRGRLRRDYNPHYRREIKTRQHCGVSNSSIRSLPRLLIDSRKHIPIVDMPRRTQSQITNQSHQRMN